MKTISILTACFALSGCAGDGAAFRERVQSIELQGVYDKNSGGSAGAKFVLRDPRRRTTSDAK